MNLACYLSLVGSWRCLHGVAGLETKVEQKVLWFEMRAILNGGKEQDIVAKAILRECRLLGGQIEETNSIKLKETNFELKKRCTIRIIEARNYKEMKDYLLNQQHCSQRNKSSRPNLCCGAYATFAPTLEYACTLVKEFPGQLIEKLRVIWID
jgi:hypothetical protein